MKYLLVVIGHIAPAMAFPFISYYRMDSEEEIKKLAWQFMERGYMLIDGDKDNFNRPLHTLEYMPGQLPRYIMAINPSAYRGIGG